MKFEFASKDDLYYSIDIKLDSGIYWYRFKFTTEYSVYDVTKFDNGKGYVSRNGSLWQLTVYNEEISYPEWLKGGVIYQIFPDRFYKSENANVNIPEGRYIQNNWTAQPEYRQGVSECDLGKDFYCGNLKGIEEKLPYIKSLGVNVIYLNPIFMASSNHRYNTMDYEKIDPVLGDEKDFKSLCAKAKKEGIHIILDGVFSHNGDDSKYFDRYHNFSNGACDDFTSPYYSWFKFEEYPNKYHSWWGIDTLPEVHEEDESYLDYICGEEGIIKKWLKLGADGWRLDVADELPDVFLDRLYKSATEEKKNCYILGEVWEDATSKIAYGLRRRYLLGGQLNSVMNYPFANGIISFLKPGGKAENFVETVYGILENYPKESVYYLMNHIGTHDTARILTELGYNGNVGDREWQSKFSLSDHARKKAIELLKVATVMQYTLPGIPSVYYGDEIGMEGFGDPFCRGAFDWEHINENLLNHYRDLGALRQDYAEDLTEGAFYVEYANDKLLAYKRGRVMIIINAYDYPAEIPVNTDGYDMLFGTIRNGKISGRRYLVLYRQG